MTDYWDPLIERMPVDELKKVQEEKLVQLVHYVYNHSIFYRKRFDKTGISPDDINSLADITRLPFTTKQDLRDTYPTGMFCVPKKMVVRSHDQWVKHKGLLISVKFNMGSINHIIEVR